MDRSLLLPRPVAQGETYDIVARFDWPGREWTQPVAAIGDPSPDQMITTENVDVEFDDLVLGHAYGDRLDLGLTATRAGT